MHHVHHQDRHPLLHLKDNAVAQRRFEHARWKCNIEGVWFRKSLGTRGIPVDLPGVYCIRHSEAGRNPEGLQP